jgi:hypothetical protein
VRGDQVGGFGEHQRGHDVVQRFADDRPDLLHIPAAAHVGHVGAHPVHLVMISTVEQEDELGVAGLEHRAAREQSLIEERFAERQRAGLGDDGLVEVEQGSRARMGSGGFPSSH